MVAIILSLTCSVFMIFRFHLLFSNIPTPVFLIEATSAHEDVTTVRPPYLFFSGLHLSLRRIASHSHPSSSLRSSSTRSPLFKDLAFFCVMSKDMSEKSSFTFSLLLLLLVSLLLLLPCFFVVVVAVVVVVEVVVVGLRACRVPSMQNAHWHLVRKDSASSSSCAVLLMTAHSHVIIAFHLSKKIQQRRSPMILLDMRSVSCCAETSPARP